VLKWVQQAHLAETKDLAAVWSVGFQVPGPGRVQVKDSCSSQSGVPRGAVELQLRLGATSGALKLKRCCCRSSNVG